MLIRGIWTLLVIFIATSLWSVPTDLAGLQGEAKADWYYQLAKDYLYDSLELAEEYAQEGLELASKLDYKVGIAQSLTLLGIALELRGEIAQGIENYEKAYLYYKEAKEDELAVGCIINMGISNYLAGDYGQALQHYERALGEAREKRLQETESKILNNIGAIQRHLEDFDQAVATYQRSLELKELLGDTLGYALTLENLGLAYSYLDRPKESMHYIGQAIERFREAGREREAAQARLTLATAQNSLGAHAEAEEELQSIIRNHFDYYTPLMKSQTYLELGKVLQSKGELELWEETLHPGFEIVKDTEHHDLISNYLEQYIALFQQTDRYALAFKFQKEYIESKEVVNEWSRMKLEKEMQARFDLAEKESQLDQQQIRITQQQRERNWFLGFALIALGLFVVAARYLQLKHNSNRQLQQQKKLIESNLKEKELLLREIHHRVKNNLQVVSSLLSLQARSLQGAEAVEALHDGKNRVRSMALIHQNLYQEEHLSGVDARSYMERLCKSLLKSYHVKNNQVTLSTDIDQILLDIDSVIPIGLIINELITNALKYAFSPGKPGLIHVSLKKEQNCLCLSVSDNGNGIDPQTVEHSESIGFKLIRAFTAKLKGTLEISNRSGTEVLCKFQSFKTVADTNHLFG